MANSLSSCLLVCS